MKYLGKNEALCTKCGQCEDCCSEAFFKTKDAAKSCIRVQKDAAESAAITVCTQCGVCIEICPIQAIFKDKNGVVRIKKDICVGCFMCVGFCPEDAMRQHDDEIEPFKCIACGLCVKACPSEAIFILDKKD